MSSSVRLFGIHGLKGAGKDTVARMIATRINHVEGYICAITHYADTLKAAAAALFNIDQNWFHNPELKEKVIPGLCVPITPRKIMTDFHDGLVPLFSPDLFVHPVKEQFRGWTGWGAFLVADVRYDVRETEWIREAGGVIIHVLRKGCSPSGHSSEEGILIHPGDFVLHNNGTLGELEAEVFRILSLTRGHILLPAALPKICAVDCNKTLTNS